MNVSWVKKEGNVSIVGITKKALENIGEIVFVQLPKVNDIVRKDNPSCVLESNKSALDFDSPVTGKVIEINEKILNDISLLNESPEEKGWLYKVKE